MHPCVVVLVGKFSRGVTKSRYPLSKKYRNFQKPFSFAEGPYQTIYLLRSNLAVSLLKRGKSFWMMQQDTFWRRNLFDLNLEDQYDFDALFDQIGHDDQSQRAEWVNGGSIFLLYVHEIFEEEFLLGDIHAWIN